MPAVLAVRLIALTAWCLAVWTVLSWTLTLEQVLFGLGLAVAVAVTLLPLGDVIGPWRIFTPRGSALVMRVFAYAARRIVLANLALSRRIWSPSRPLRSGMVITPTSQVTPAGLTTVALVTSVIVESQAVDIAVADRELQYHAVDVPRPGQEWDRINGPLERILRGRRE